MNYERELETARKAAALAGVLQMEARREGLQIERKSDASPVTEIDKRCEQVIFDTLREIFPNDSFLGEETGQHDGPSGRRWIVDPLDGTRPFIRGIPTHSALVALEEDGRPVVGVIELPALKTTYWAAAGGGAFKNGVPIHVSDIAQLSQVTGSALGYIQEAGTPRAEALLNLMGTWEYVYGFMDGFTYGLIAEGALDVCVNLLDKAWDCAAAACIISEAGGRFSDLDGKPTVHSGGIIFSNGHVHDKTLNALLAKKRTIAMQTTFLRKKSDMPTRNLDRCHDGNGALHWIGVLDGQAPGGERLRFIHDDILPPGTSIGIHRHTNDQEYYYILSGRGVMTLDGREYEVAAGDVTAVLPGGSHGLENRSDGDIRVIVISVAGGKA